jgi:hypothetical protein
MIVKILAVAIHDGRIRWEERRDFMTFIYFLKRRVASMILSIYIGAPVDQQCCNWTVGKICSHVGWGRI